MSLLLTGTTIGLLTALMFIVLVEKSPRIVRELIFGHRLVSDLAFTFLALAVLPVTGAMTLLAVAVVTVLFSAYLELRRKRHPWRIIVFKNGLPKIERRRDGKY